jgi:hypothetical protein
MMSDAEHQALLDGVRERFGVELLRLQQATPPHYRSDAMTHGFFDPEKKLTDDLRRDIRRWI